MNSYDYYVATYDGYGETTPALLGSVLAGSITNPSKVVMSFVVPYEAKGFTIYRKDTNSIGGVVFNKIGPFIGKADETNIFQDYGNKGVWVDSLPNSDTTNKYVFKPKQDSKPIAVDISYYFYGGKNL